MHYPFEPYEPEINDAALEWATRQLFIDLTNHGDISAAQFHNMKEIARETILSYLKELPDAIRRMPRGNSVLTD